ncbi:MAG: phosphatase PAP2 family protein [Fidelibacterota bacterium]|jgi:membrane-associated phospholipid phosphatase
MESQTTTAPYKRISPGYMLLLLASTFVISILYYQMALLFSDNPMPMFDYVVFTCIVAIIILGAYQIFFWVQNNNYFFKTRCLAIGIDKYIPFWPIWIWPYSFIYYIMIGMVVIQISSLSEGLYHIFGGLMVLLAQCVFFMIFPCRVPKSYREYEVKNTSTRYLKFVQGLDNGRNCFPSMHNSVAAYVGLVLLPTIGIWSYVFIASIAISSLLVKQHQFLDIVPGLLLGWGIHTLVTLI